MLHRFFLFVKLLKTTSVTKNESRGLKEEFKIVLLKFLYFVSVQEYLKTDQNY